MKVAAAVLTYQAISNGRLGLLEQTVRSLAEADTVIIVDNGSTDGTREVVERQGGISHDGPLHTSGHGNNLQARVLLGTDADVCVLSDDDMLWKPGWRAKLEAWWTGAPDDVVLTGCHIEPAFHWNVIAGRVEYGGVPGLVRQSSGGASWSLRHRDLETFFGPAGIWQQHQGYGDVMACDRLIGRGFKVCQIDLAEHAGQGQSTWGNSTETKYGWDVEPVLALLHGGPSCPSTVTGAQVRQLAHQ